MDVDVRMVVKGVLSNSKVTEDSLYRWMIFGLTSTYAWQSITSSGSGTFQYYWYPYTNFQILDIDYDSYYVAYSCTAYPFSWLPVVSVEGATINSRSRTLEDDTVDRAYLMLSTKVPTYDWKEKLVKVN